MKSEQPAGTRDRILDAAEKLFAAKGYNGTSLRAITGEAGANLAAINYHFGSKEGLLREVLHRRIDPLNTERLLLLDQLEAEGDYDPSRILRALLEPAVKVKERFGVQGEAVVSIIGHLHANPPTIAEELFRDLFQDMFKRFDQAFARALPELPDHVRGLRLHFTLGSMVHILRCEDLLRFSCHPRKDDDPSTLLNQLISFTAAGMTAPLSSGRNSREDRK